MKSYSEVVSKSTTSAKQSFSKPVIKSIKRVVEEVVEAEDRSKNIVIFGIKEEVGEVVGEQVDKLFEHLGTKLRHESVRIGVKREDLRKNPERLRSVYRTHQMCYSSYVQHEA